MAELRDRNAKMALKMEKDEETITGLKEEIDELDTWNE